MRLFEELFCTLKTNKVQILQAKLMLIDPLLKVDFHSAGNVVQLTFRVHALSSELR